MKPTILYENENYIVVNKPSGLIVHSDGKREEPSLVDWVVANYPEMENVGENIVLNNGKEIKRSGIVHRIDKETSGIVILAKNQKAFENLKEQFKKREVQKIYKAFVYGNVKEKEGIIDREIGKSSKFGLWSAQRGKRGKVREAITEYKVLEKGKENTYLELKPRTGRTHQIRVHLKAINHPVVCDKLYAQKKECELGFNRLALHAERIKFSGLNREEIEVEAPLPNDFLKAQKLIAGVAE